MWSKIPAPVQQTIVKIALVAAAIGPILVVVGKIISAVGTIATIATAGFRCYRCGKRCNGSTERYHAGKSYRPDYRCDYCADGCLHLSVEYERGLPAVLDRPLGTSSRR